MLEATLDVVGMQEALQRRAETDPHLQRKLQSGPSEQTIMDLYVRFELGHRIPAPITRPLGAGRRKAGSHGENRHR